MLPLPIFQLHRPTSLDAAVSLLAQLGPSARIVAGGTDMLPNMKQGLVEPEHLVSVQHIAELRRIGIESTDAGEFLVVGAGMRLAEIAEDTLTKRFATALAEAAGLVGGPHHRAMGTLGGNLCLDTRCRYYNQTYFWRKSLGFCLKKDGTVCHVVKGGQKCVAAASNDTAPAALVLDAEVRLVSHEGARTVPARDFYTADGIANTTIRPTEVVTSLAVPIIGGRRSAFGKIRRRGAIDFPLLNVAIRREADGTGACVVSALGARPRVLRKADAAFQKDDWKTALAEAAASECKPLANIDLEPGWRRDMVPVLVRETAERLG